MKLHFEQKPMLKILAVLVILTGLTACQTQAIWDTSPDFGGTVNGAVQSQLVNPNAPLDNKKVTTGLDGGAAKGAVDNYQKSFEVKAPTSSGTYPTGATMGTSSGGGR
ncbi:hypothetical protein [Polynucleobacter sp. AP-Reno-20A-A9]|uniref:hypothetical protein n=1 Tax=Polynucleobacter sp. AP-Reno-20A-A9 TaxID=2576925 RepID=UPI001C0AFD9E|nr:hypothetical protein [Polynucleobacter sp. AP-Reno-20A-A9]MBU3628866.1 hypothetical protein [Polynucleobacter sp. AP-Reno-20A-A9]